PDILNTINVSGNVCVSRKEVMEDKVKIEGNVNTYIMYLPDSKEDNLRGLTANIDFSQSITMSGCREGMTAVTSVSIKDTECKVLNGRKINVKVGLEVDIKLYSNENIDIIERVNNIDDIQVLEKDFTINSLVGSGNTRIYAKETLSIDQQDELAEILRTEINLVENDIKVSYNKVLTKAEADMKIMYLTEDNRINTVTGRIPVVGFIDIQDISEENICDVTSEIRSMQVRPNPSEEHSIYVEIELETACMAFEKKSVKIMQDLYSPSIELGFSQRNISTLTDKISKLKNFTVTSKTNIENLQEGNLIDVDVRTIINKEQVMTSRIMYEGELVLNFVFSQENNNINSKISRIPFEFSMDNPLSNEQININTKATVSSKRFEVKSGGDIECNIDMEFNVEFNRNTNITVIDNIDVIESRDINMEYDSLILYIIQDGDTLWKIAKKFRSTIDEIVRMNGIENPEVIYAGNKLYIPRFKYRNRKENSNAGREPVYL
ncbi:MAG: DUF3794 domain-containing protein, partial [Clostridia bacterium]|nr:DUF3794 domain-containing protein [Clostridia bacterium]